MTKIYLPPEFKTAKAYEKHLRALGKIHDVVEIDGITFEQTYYDMEGELIEYKGENGDVMEIQTTNRYGEKKWSDAKVIIVKF